MAVLPVKRPRLARRSMPADGNGAAVECPEVRHLPPAALAKTYTIYRCGRKGTRSLRLAQPLARGDASRRRPVGMRDLVGEHLDEMIELAGRRRNAQRLIDVGLGGRVGDDPLHHRLVA